MKKLILCEEQLNICDYIEQLYNQNKIIYRIKTNILFSSIPEKNLDFCENEFDIIQDSFYDCACNLFLVLLTQLNILNDRNENQYIDEFRDNWFFNNPHVTFISWLDKLYTKMNGGELNE